MLNSDNRNFLYTVIFTFVTLAVIWSLYGFRKEVFYAKNKSMETALAEGVGFYETPISLGCITSDNLCDKPGTVTYVSRCVPHPDTGKGCIDEETGTMTYETKITTESCNKPCVRHAFSVQQGIDFETEEQATGVAPPAGETQTKQVFNKGVNHVIDPYYGIDHTSDYFGDYNSTTQMYSMKTVPGTTYGKCIPTNLIGYIQTKYACVNNDQSGLNLCNYMCGVDDTIGVSGLFVDNTTSKNVLMHYPYREQDDGERFYYCYDQIGNNLLEGLYNSETVPTDFLYPKVCYTRHITNFDQKSSLLTPVTYNSKFITLGALIQENINFEVTDDIGNSDLALPTTYTENDTESMIIAKVGVEYMRVKSITSGINTATTIVNKFYLYSNVDMSFTAFIVHTSTTFFDEYKFVYELTAFIDLNITSYDLTTSTITLSQGSSAVCLGIIEGSPNVLLFTPTGNAIGEYIVEPSLSKLSYIDNAVVKVFFANANQGIIDQMKTVVYNSFVTKGLLLSGTFDDIKSINQSVSYLCENNEEVTFNLSKVLTKSTSSRTVPYSYNIIYGGNFTNPITSSTELSVNNFPITLFVDSTSQSIILEVERQFPDPESSLVVPHPRGTEVHFMHNLAEKVADFTELMSPYILNADGTTQNACFDEYNRPRPKGYKVHMEPGQTLIVNTESKEYNLDTSEHNVESAICGVYGYLEDDNSAPKPPYQTREGYIQPNVTNENCVISATDNATNNVSNMFKLGISSDTSINELACFAGYYKDAETRLCHVPVDPTEYDSTKSYSEGDVVYIQLYDSQFYLSLAYNNNSELSNPNKWREINYFDSVIENVSKGEYYITRTPNLLKIIDYTGGNNTNAQAEYSWSVFTVQEGGLRSYDVSGSYNPYIDKNLYFPPKLVDATLELNIPKGMSKYPFDSAKPIITKPFYMEMFVNKLIYAPTEITIDTLGNIVTSDNSVYRKFTSDGDNDFTFINPSAINNNAYYDTFNNNEMFLQGTGNWQHGLRLDVRPDIVYNNSFLTLTDAIDNSEHQIDYRGFRCSHGQNTHAQTFTTNFGFQGTFPLGIVSADYQPNWNTVVQADINANRAYGSKFGVFLNGVLPQSLVSKANDLYWDVGVLGSNNVPFVRSDSSFGAKQLAERFTSSLTNRVRMFFWPIYLPESSLKDSTARSFNNTTIPSLQTMNQNASQEQAMTFTVPNSFAKHYKLSVTLNDYTYEIPGNDIYKHLTELEFYIKHSYTYNSTTWRSTIDNAFTDVRAAIDTIYTAGTIDIVPLFASKSIKEDINNLNVDNKSYYTIQYDSANDTFDCVKKDPVAKLGDFNSLATFDYFEAFNTMYAKELSTVITDVTDTSVESTNAGTLWNSYSVEDGEFIIGRQDDVQNDSYRLVLLQKNQDFAKLDLYLNYPRPPAIFSLPDIEPFAVKPEQYSKIYCYINNVESIYSTGDDTGFIQRGKGVMWDDADKPFDNNVQSISGQNWNKKYMPFNQTTMQTGYSRLPKSIPGKLVYDGWGFRGTHTGAQEPNVGQYVVNVFLLNLRNNNKLMPIYRVDEITPATLQVWYLTNTLTNPTQATTDLAPVGGNNDWHIDTTRYLFELPSHTTTLSDTKWQTYLNNVWTPPGAAFQRDCSFIDGPQGNMTELYENASYYSIPFTWQNSVTPFFDSTIGTTDLQTVLYNDLVRTLFWGSGQNGWSSTMKLYNNYNVITGTNSDQASIAPVFDQTATGLSNGVMNTTSGTYVKIGNTYSPFVEDYLYTNQGTDQYTTYNPITPMTDAATPSITVDNIVTLPITYATKLNADLKEPVNHEYPAMIDMLKTYVENHVTGTDAVRLPLISSYSDIDDIPTSNVKGFYGEINRATYISNFKLSTSPSQIIYTNYSYTSHTHVDNAIDSYRMTQLYTNSLSGYSGLYYMIKVCRTPISEGGISDWFNTALNPQGLLNIYNSMFSDSIDLTDYNILGLYNLMSSIGIKMNPFMYDTKQHYYNNTQNPYVPNFTTTIPDTMIPQVGATLVQSVVPMTGTWAYKIFVPATPQTQNTTYTLSGVNSNTKVIDAANYVLSGLGENPINTRFNNFNGWNVVNYTEITNPTEMNVTGSGGTLIPQFSSFLNPLTFPLYSNNIIPASLAYSINDPISNYNYLFKLYWRGGNAQLTNSNPDQPIHFMDTVNNEMIRMIAASVFGKAGIQNNKVFSDYLYNPQQYFLGGNQQTLIPYLIGLVHKYHNPYGIPTSYGNGSDLNVNNVWFEQRDIVPPNALSGVYGYYHKVADTNQELLNNIPKPIRAMNDLRGYPNDGVTDITTPVATVNSMNYFFDNLSDIITGGDMVSIINNMNKSLYQTQKEFFSGRNLNEFIPYNPRYFHYDLPTNYYPGGWGLPTYSKDKAEKMSTFRPDSNLTFPLNDAIPQFPYYFHRYPGKSFVYPEKHTIYYDISYLPISDSIDEAWIPKSTTYSNYRTNSAVSYNKVSGYNPGVVTSWEEQTTPSSPYKGTGYPLFIKSTVDSDIIEYNGDYVLGKLTSSNAVSTNYTGAPFTPNNNNGIVVNFQVKPFYRLESPKWTSFASSVFPSDGYIIDEVTNVQPYQIVKTARQDTPHFWNYQANNGENVLNDEYNTSDVSIIQFTGPFPTSGTFTLENNNIVVEFYSNNGNDLEFNRIVSMDDITVHKITVLNSPQQNSINLEVFVENHINGHHIFATLLIKPFPNPANTSRKPVQVFGGRQESFMFVPITTPSGYTNMTASVTGPNSTNTYMNTYMSNYCVNSPKYFPPVYDKNFIIQYKNNVRFNEAFVSPTQIVENYKDISRMLQNYNIITRTALNNTSFAEVSGNQVTLPIQFGYSDSLSTATEFLYAPVILTVDQDPYMWNEISYTTVRPALVKIGNPGVTNTSYNDLDITRTLFSNSVKDPNPLKIVSWIGDGSTKSINETFNIADHGSLVALSLGQEDSQGQLMERIFGSIEQNANVLGTFVQNPTSQVYPNIYSNDKIVMGSVSPTVTNNVGYIQNFNNTSVSYPYYHATNSNYEYTPLFLLQGRVADNYNLETTVPPYSNKTNQFWNIQSRLYKDDNRASNIVTKFHDLVYNNGSTNINYPNAASTTAPDISNQTVLDNVRNVFTRGSNLIGRNFSSRPYVVKTAKVSPNLLFKAPYMNLGDSYNYQGVVTTGVTKYLNDTGYGQQVPNFTWPTNQVIRSSNPNITSNGFVPQQSPIIQKVYNRPSSFGPKNTWIYNQDFITDSEEYGSLNYLYCDYYDNSILPNIGRVDDQYYQKYEDKVQYSVITTDTELFESTLDNYLNGTNNLSLQYFITDINGTADGEEQVTTTENSIIDYGGDTYKLIAITDLLDQQVPYLFEGVDSNNTDSEQKPIWHRLNPTGETFEFKTLLMYEYSTATNDNETTILKSNFFIDNSGADSYLRAKVDATDAWSSVNDLTLYQQSGQLQDQMFPAYGCMPMSGGKMVWNELNFDATGNRVNEDINDTVQTRAHNYLSVYARNTPGNRSLKRDYKATKFALESTDITNTFLNDENTTYYIYTSNDDISLSHIYFNTSATNTMDITLTFTNTTNRTQFVGSPTKTTSNGVTKVTYNGISKTALQNTIITITTGTTIEIKNSGNLFGNTPSFSLYNASTIYGVLPSIKGLNNDVLKNLTISGKFAETGNGYGLYLSQEFFNEYLEDILPGQGTYINAVLNPFKQSMGDNIFYKSSSVEVDESTNITTFSYNFFNSNTPERPDNVKYASTHSTPRNVFYVNAPNRSNIALGYEGSTTDTYREVSYTKAQEFETPFVNFGDTYIMPVSSQTVFTKIGGPRFFYYQEFDYQNEQMLETKTGTFTFPYNITVTDVLDLRLVFGLGTINSGGIQESNDMYQIALNDIKNFIIRLSPGDVFIIEQPFDFTNDDYAFTVVSMDVLNYSVIVEADKYDTSTGTMTALRSDNITITSEYTYIKLFKTYAGIDGSGIGVVDIYDLDFREGRVVYNANNLTDYTNFTVVKPAVISGFNMISDSVIDKRPGRSIYNSKFNIVFCTSEYPPAKLFDVFGNFTSDISDSTIATEYRINERYNAYEIVASNGKQDVFFKALGDVSAGTPPFNDSYVRSNLWAFLNIPDSVIPEKIEWEPYKVYDMNTVTYRDARMFPYINYNTGETLDSKDAIVSFFPSTYPFRLFRNENLDINYYKSTKSSNENNDPMFRKPYISFDPVTVYSEENPQELAYISKVKDCVLMTYTEWTQTPYQGCDEPFGIYSNNQGTLSFDIEKIIAAEFVDQLSVKSVQKFTTEEISPFYTGTTFTSLPTTIGTLIVSEQGDYIYLQDNTNNYYKIDNTGFVLQNSPTPFFVKNYINDTEFYIVYVPPPTDTTTYYISSPNITTKISLINDKINRDRIVASCLKNDTIWNDYSIPTSLTGSSTFFSHDAQTLYDNYKSNYTGEAYITKTDTTKFSSTQTCVYFDNTVTTTDFATYTNFTGLLGKYVTAKYEASNDLYFLLTLQNTPCVAGATTEYASDCNADVFDKLNAQAVSFMPVDANGGNADVGLMGKPLCNPTSTIVSNSKFDFANGLFLYFVPLEIGYQPPVGDNTMYCRIMTYYGTQFMGWLKFNRSIEINRDHEITTLNTNNEVPIMSTCPAYVYYDNMNILNTKRETSVLIGNQVVQTKLKGEVTDDHVYYTTNYEDENVFKVVYNVNTSKYDILKLDADDMYFQVSAVITNTSGATYHTGANSDYLLAGSYWSNFTGLVENSNYLVNITGVGSGVFTYDGTYLVRHKDFDTYNKILNNRNVRHNTITKFNLVPDQDINSNTAALITINVVFSNPITNTNILEYYTSTPTSTPGGTYIVNNPNTPSQSGVFNQNGTDFTPAPTDSTVYRITSGRRKNTYWTVKDVDGINVVKEVTHLYNDVAALTNRTNNLNVDDIPLIDSFTREKTLAQGFPLRGLTLTEALDLANIQDNDDIINFNEIRGSRKPLELLTNINNDCNIMFTYNPFADASILYVYQFSGTSTALELKDVTSISESLFEVGTTLTKDILFMFKYAVYLNFEFLDKAPTFAITSGTGYEVLVSYFLGGEQIGETKPLGQNSDSEFNTKFAARTEQEENYVLFQPIKKAGSTGQFQFTISYDGVTSLATFTVT